MTTKWIANWKKVARAQVILQHRRNDGRQPDEIRLANVNLTNSKSEYTIDWFYIGVSMQLNQLFHFIYRESNLLKRIFQCCMLNGGFFGLSIILFEYVLLPIIRIFLNWMFTRHPGNGALIGNYIVTFLSILFGMIWVMPLFILSKVVNSLWFQVSWTNEITNVNFNGDFRLFFFDCRILPIQRINFAKVNRNCLLVSVWL